MWGIKEIDRIVELCARDLAFIWLECRQCRKQGKDYMEKSPLPNPVLLHSIASPSGIAWIIHQKYEMAVPLYRLEKEWEAMGILPYQE